MDISERGLAQKNDAALFALALAMSPKYAGGATRRAALDAMPRVARTASHLFQLLHYAAKLRGWGKGLRRAVARWYNEKPIDRLAGPFGQRFFFRSVLLLIAEFYGKGSSGNLNNRGIIKGL